MKHFFKKAVAVLLAVILVASVGSVGAFAQTGKTADSDSTYYKGAFYYRPGTGEYDHGTDNADYYIYSDDYFKKSGKVYDPHLSTMSYTLAIASVNSTREEFDEEGYKRKNRNVLALLDDIGFSDISINDDYRKKPTKDSLGIACAHKTIVQDGKAYTLLAIVPRSAGYEAEWGNNFVLGADGNALGFDACAERCLAFAKDYIADQGISGDIKAWTVGYSRGASIANLTAAKLIDDPQGYLGDAVTLDSENLYAYTCGTPSGADVDNDPHNEKYAGIFNSYLETELASAMAPTDMGFARYGTDRVLYRADKYDEMLDNLGVINDYVHNTYSTSINSNRFHPKKLGLVDGSLGMANDNASYIPSDPAEYLSGMCTYLDVITGGREEYAKTYEQPFSDLIAYYESLSEEESAAMMSALTGNDETIYMAVALYAYFMRAKSKANWDYTLEQLKEKVTEIAAVGADGEEYANTGIGADTIAKAAGLLGLYLLMDAESVKQIAAGYLSKVLNEAMTASGASQEEIDAITNQNACLALTHLLSHLLLGNIWQSDEVHPLLLNNQQMKSAATLLGNAANLFVDHANEIIISWLKTEDSYYHDFGPFEGSQLNGYRRVYVKTAGAAINGNITDANGNVIAQIVDGVVKNSEDRWIGFTSTDDGGFFRIPADSDYQIRFRTAESSEVSVGVGEYEVYSAETTMLLDETVSAKAGNMVVITLPALDEPFEMPSATAYSVTVSTGILGDIDMNNEVEIIDTTLLQRYLSHSITLSDEQLKLADADSSGLADILDVTALQRYLGNFKAPYGIGMPIE